MKKLFKSLAIVLLVLVGLPLAVVIAINAFDETLSPQAAAYGEPRAPSVPDAQNGYFAMLAIGAPDGADGAAFARAWVEEERAAGRANRPPNRPTPKRAKRAAACDAAQTSCLVLAGAKPDDTKAQLDAYTEDIARYEALIAYRRYEEVLDFPLHVTTSFPGYPALMAAQRAYLLRAAVAAGSGNVEAAVAAVDRDLAFQRTMLTGARTLLGKIVAAANYWRDLALLSDLMQSRPADVRPHLARVRETLKAPEFPVAGMGVTVESEFAFRKSQLRNPLANSGADMAPSAVEQIAVRLFYKPNATLNREVQYLAAVAAAMNLPVGEGTQALTKLMREEAEMTVWDYVNNPVGNLLRRIAIPDDGREAYGRLRFHDAHAYGRLVALQAELLAANVDADRVGAFVAQSEARFHDPHAGKPMMWDRESKRLGFQALSKSTQQRKLFNTDKGRVYVQL